MTAEFEITRDVITKSLRQGWELPWRTVAAHLLSELNKRPTVDACIIAALETKLAEAERSKDICDKDLLNAAATQAARAEAAEAALEVAIKRAARAEVALATAHDALHDCGFLGGNRP